MQRKESCKDPSSRAGFRQDSTWRFLARSCRQAIPLSLFAVWLASRREFRQLAWVGQDQSEHFFIGFSILLYYFHWGYFARKIVAFIRVLLITSKSPTHSAMPCIFARFLSHSNTSAGGRYGIGGRGANNCSRLSGRNCVILTPVIRTINGERNRLEIIDWTHSLIREKPFENCENLAATRIFTRHAPIFHARGPCKFKSSYCKIP